MIRLIIYINFILITFYACSDSFIADKIADNYSVGTLICPDFGIEDEFQNVEISYFTNGSIEIDLGSTIGILEGEIFDDSEIKTEAFKGLSPSGIELDLPSGTGDFNLDETENGKFKTVHIKFQTPEDRRNICTLILRKF